MTHKFTYTLISYRPNGEDTCRGCSMGRSDSEHSVKVHSTPQLVAHDWAQQLFQESETDAREICSVEYTLLVDGRTEGCDNGWDEPENPLLCDKHGNPWADLERPRIQVMVDAKLAELQEAKRVEAARKDAIAATARHVEAQARHVAAEAKERAEFLRLQSKFGATM